MHNKTEIGQYLKEHGEILIAPLGGSMLPLLKGDNCQVILKVPKESLRKFDVVLYRSGSGKLILHRIIKVQPSSYTLCGDNTYTFETGIMKEQILGIMTGFYRKNTYISCERAGYRFYVKLWWLLYPLRKTAAGVFRVMRGRTGRTGND